MQLSDFDYALPAELIAQYPPAERSAGRLLDCRAGRLVDRQIRDLDGLFEPGDLLVFNDTRVIKARLAARKVTGGALELMIDRMQDEFSAYALIRASHAPKPGALLYLAEGDTLEVIQRTDDLYLLRSVRPFAEILERMGQLPLPPYITHPADQSDECRYQTVFARHPGAVAAPTAGLHFDAALLAALAARGIDCAWLTLHVGAGTFLPVRNDDVSQHVMHAESYSISQSLQEAILRARQRARRVVAIGTTTLRALESAADGHGNVHAGGGLTRLFITPGYQFQVVDSLMTNFHLPKSTLLMLVSAFAGVEFIREAYRHAIAARYRFFSYGDAMLLERT